MSAVPGVWLDCNENPFAWPPGLLRRAWERLLAAGVNRYPRDGGALREGLARYAGVPAEWVLPGNGSDELIVALLCSLGRRVGRVVMPWPTFTFYRRLAEALGLAVTTVELDGDFSLQVEDVVRALAGGGGPALVVLCRPNNPTGNLFPREAVLAALEGGAWVVADEAYFEFCGETVCDLLPDHPRLVVLRTLSKAFALAGLRVGYALGHPGTLAAVRSVMQPFGVDAFAAAAALVALDHVDLVRGWVGEVCRWREELRGELCGLPGLRACPSRANFLLVELLRARGSPDRAQTAEGGSAPALCGALAREGVRVRCWPEEPRLSRFFRVTVGLPEENRRLVEVLRRLAGAGAVAG